MLSVIEESLLGLKLIDDLLKLMDLTPDSTQQPIAQRDRLTGEIGNLVKSVPKGMPAETVTPGEGISA
jgi:hypothetical protein